MDATKEWTVSADSHLVEPPDLFTSRLPGHLKELAPHVILQEGVEWWTADGKMALPVFFPARAGDRFENRGWGPDGQEVVKTRTHYSPVPPGHERSTFANDVRLGAYRPSDWMKENAVDGVRGGVIAPSMTIFFLSFITDSELMSAVCRAYSDFALEFGSEFPGQMRMLGLLNLDDIPAAVKELTRLKENGAAGALIPVSPPFSRPYCLPDYEPLWDAAQDLDIILTLHTATNRNIGDQMRHLTSASGMINDSDHVVRVALSDIIMAGVFDKRPKLRMVSAENEGGWAPYFMERMDWHYQNNFRLTGGYRFGPDTLPSDYMKSNVYISFIEDPVLVRLRDFVGVDRLLWGNDFPHAEATFPQSDSILDRMFAGVPDEERLAMTRDNVIKLYDFELPEFVPA